MTDIVFAHVDPVAKIVGDAFHETVWSAKWRIEGATGAVTCALALDDWAQSFRERRRKRESSPILDDFIDPLFAATFAE